MNKNIKFTIEKEGSTKSQDFIIEENDIGGNFDYYDNFLVEKYYPYPSENLGFDDNSWIKLKISFITGDSNIEINNQKISFGYKNSTIDKDCVFIWKGEKNYVFRWFHKNEDGKIVLVNNDNKTEELKKYIIEKKVYSFTSEKIGAVNSYRWKKGEKFFSQKAEFVPSDDKAY